jgi:hypothetical protein
LNLFLEIIAVVEVFFFSLLLIFQLIQHRSKCSDEERVTDRSDTQWLRIKHCLFKHFRAVSMYNIPQDRGTE